MSIAWDWERQLPGEDEPMRYCLGNLNAFEDTGGRPVSSYLYVHLEQQILLKC